jgi:MoaA/NifB/PqqE/SkfB family radical SAM enzyme
MSQKNRERIESSGLTTSYDPIARTMTVFDSEQRVLSRKLNQEEIEFPTRVVFEIESYCSSGCRYCSEGKSVQCRRNIPKQRLVELIDEVEEMRTHELTLRGGEAAEHPFFNEVWEYASQIEFTAPNIITNGMSFTKEGYAEFLRNPLSKLIVSIDGFNEINSINRNPKQYGLVIPWILDAAQNHPDQVVVLSCLYRQNIEEIPRFARFLAEQGLRHYHLPPLKRLGRSEIADENFVSLAEMDILQGKLGEITADFEKFKPVISCTELAQYDSNKTNRIPVPLFNEMNYGTGLKVIPTGDVMVNRAIMFTDKFKNEVNAQTNLEPLGNIYENSLKDIWKKSLELRIEQEKIADKHYAYYLGWLKTL